MNKFFIIINYFQNKMLKIIVNNKNKKNNKKNSK